MAKIDTNAIGLKVAAEAVEGEPPDDGYSQIEPNEIGAFGTALTTTARSPISTARQRRKGAVTDLESAAEWTEDLTYSGLRTIIEAALFAKADNAEVSNIAASSVTTGAQGGYNVAALGADQAALLHQHTLLWADSFDLAANNGLKLVVMSPVVAAVRLRVNGLAVAATGGFAALAGYRVPAATDKQWTWDAASRVATLAVDDLGSAADGLRGRGLAAGQLVHIGSVASRVSLALQNGLVSGNDRWYGYARVKSFTDDTIVFDRVSNELQNSQAAADDANALDLVFGEFLRNVPTGDPLFLRRPLTLELENPGLTDPTTTVDGQVAIGENTVTVTSVAGLAIGDSIEIGDGLFFRIGAIAGLVLTLDRNTAAAIADETPLRPVKDYEYSVGNLINTLTLNLPLTEKATMAIAMVGRDTEAAGLQKGRQANGSARAGDAEPRGTAPYNTVSDFARLRVIEEDEDGLTTDFKSASLVIGNNITGEKTLAVLGNRYVNTGNLEVTFSSQVVFSSAGVPRAIRENETLAADFILKNSDGVIGIDLPAVTIGGGGREFPVNQSVLINAEVQSFADPVLDTSIGISLIPVPLPAVA